MTQARRILSPQQQAIEQRLKLCDGCNDPNHRPLWSMAVQVATLHGGSLSKSIFLICPQCASKPIHLFLNGSGRNAPGIKVQDEPALDGQVETVEVFEPEIIDNRPRKARK